MHEELDRLACYSPLVRPQLSDEDAVELERLFQAFADRNASRSSTCSRRWAARPVCVCEFQEAIGIKQPTVSYHLKQLVEAGVIAREQCGRYAFYSLRPEVLERIAELVRPQEPVVS